MRAVLILVAAGLVCGIQAQQAKQGSSAGVERRTLRVAGMERVFYIYRPAGKPRGPYPIVFAIHGGDGQALGMRRVGFEPVADAHGFAVVYPEGHNRGWNDGRLGARIVKRAEGADDVGFFRSIIDGTKDPLVPWNGGPVAGNSSGGRVVSVDKTLELWRRLDGCAETTTTRELPDTDPGDGTRTTEIVWPRCAGQAELRLFRVEGGGHGWHGPPSRMNAARVALTGHVSMDFSGAGEVWRFFCRFALPKQP